MVGVNCTMAARASDRWNRTQAAWLALAVLAHALLLLLPIGPIEFSTATTPALKIRFVPVSRTAQKAAIAPPRAAADTPRTEAARPPADGIAMAAATTTAEKPAVTKSAATPTPGRITLPRLLQSLEHARLERPHAPAARQLGAQPDHASPSHWRSRAAGALPSGDGFGDNVAPSVRAEIVDRWRAADGSHNVLVNLPNGETLCGRATEWDPLRPLVETVMHFRDCGSGNPSTFNLLAQKIRRSISPIE